MKALKKLGVRTGPFLQGSDWEPAGQGAEARLFRGTFEGRPALMKERFVKAYRHPTLDSQLARERTRAEARTNVKCKAAGIPTPDIFLVDMEQRVIVMEDIRSTTLKKYIKDLEGDASPTAQAKLSVLAEKLGSLIGILHASNLIHGDLTTSNVLLKDDDKLVLIDFGLSSMDVSAEDKAVDLYVLERALASTHPNMEPLIPQILEAYEKRYEEGAGKVLKKLEDVRMRGRKRTMVG